MHNKDKLTDFINDIRVNCGRSVIAENDVHDVYQMNELTKLLINDVTLKLNLHPVLIMCKFRMSHNFRKEKGV